MTTLSEDRKKKAAKYLKEEQPDVFEFIRDFSEGFRGSEIYYGERKNVNKD